ncbi:hypothetical protein D3C84_660820 [compost metagenome]
MLTAETQHGLALGILGADQCVNPHQAAGNQQRRLQFALDLADLGLCQAAQALLDDLFELGLGPLLDHFLGACAGKQRVQHQRNHHAEHDGSGECGDGKLNRLEFHKGSGRRRASAELYRRGDGGP